MAYTPGYSGLLNSAFPRIGQYEAATGRRINKQVVQGLLQADLDKAKQFSMAEDFRNRQLAMQQQQINMQKDAQRANQIAGMVGGVGQLTQLPLAYMATKNLLGMGGKAAATSAPGLLGGGAQAAVAPAVAGTTAQAPLLAAPGALQAPGYAAPLIQGPTTFAAEGAGTAASAPAVAGGGMSTLGALGAAGALAGAQYYTGKLAQPYLDKAGFSTAGKGWTYGGLPGAMLGGSIDVGKKLYEGAKDFISKIF